MRRTTLFTATLAIAATPLLAAATPAERARPRPDLADIAAGTYHGEVISDSRGSSQADVTLTVTKVSPNRVSVTSSYPRLPTHVVGLTRAMQTIQQTGTASVFLLDLARTPRHLDVTVDGASWSGDRE